MSVYYESLCPDSIRFVTQQLYPNWLHFGSEILTVDLNPFGKANVSIECSVPTRVACTWQCCSSPCPGLGGTSRASTGRTSAAATRCRPVCWTR